MGQDQAELQQRASGEAGRRGVSRDTPASPIPVSAGQPGAPLGIYGKYPAAAQGQRREKYQLQNAARKLRQGFPVTKCLRWAIPNSHIKIIHHPEFGKAGYAGLETCGSVWECPVCASKISERRRVEVQTAIAMHKAKGGEVLLLTLTSPHKYGDSLAVLLAAQAKALDGFRKNRPGRRFFESLGTVGTIRALEVLDGTPNTTGNNGWHPHFHILLFVAQGVDMEKAHRTAFGIWADECMKAGLGIPSFKHGVDLRDGSYAEKYVSKWGLENEMTKGHIKKGGKRGRSPFDLLRCYNEGDKQAGALFVEYATHFKGKRQLVWSNGLKALFAIEEATDIEVAEREEERAELGAELSRDDWKIILNFDVRAEILEAFENGGAFEVAHCIAMLREETQLTGKAAQVKADLAELQEFMGWTPERLAEFLAWQLEDAACR